MKIDPNSTASPEIATDPERSGSGVYGNTYTYGGLTIRAELAARCLQALLSNPVALATFSEAVDEGEHNENDAPDFFALMAVEHADALITALNTVS